MKHSWLVLWLALPASVWGQDPGDIKLQFHGLVAQGGLLSSHNNYLTANTSDGSTQWTEAAVNAIAAISDNFRVGLQVHTYRLGELGQMKLEVDWAYGDYRFREWLGLRAGKVKTPLGLFNDTQDIDSLHLWALLPQSVYPADNRSWTLAHTGGDLYGRVGLPARLGSLSYQGYFGSRTVDPADGYFQSAADAGLTVQGSPFGRLYGGDLRWQTPRHGWMAGASVGLADISGTVTFGSLPFPITIRSTSDTNTALYGEYENGKWYAAGEFRRRIWNLTIPELGIAAAGLDSRAGYVMGSYRVHPKLNLGAYWSHFEYARIESMNVPFNSPSCNDWVAAARFDPNHYFYLKLEAHYLDGNATGFYQSTNPRGLDRVTHLLAAKIGFSF